MDFTKTNNFRGLELIKKLAKTKAIKLPETINLDNTLTYTPNNAEIEKLASSSFANSINREYPIDSPVNTWLSAVYFYTDGQTTKTAAAGDVSKIEQNIHLAAEMHDIGECIDSLCDALSEYADDQLCKLASEGVSKKYAFSTEEENGAVNYLPINSIEEIMKSAKELEINKNKIPVMIFKAASENIVKEFAAYDKNIRSKYTLPTNVKKAGQRFLINYDRLSELVSDRVAETKDTRYTEIAKQASAEYEKSPDQSTYREALNRICELDICNGIHENYGKSTLDPFSYTQDSITEEDAIKLASEYLELNSAVVPFEALKKADVQEAIVNSFSKEASEKIISAINTENANAITFSDDAKLNDVEADRLLKIVIARG